MRISDWSSDVCSSDLKREDQFTRHYGAVPWPRSSDPHAPSRYTMIASWSHDASRAWRVPSTHRQLEFRPQSAGSSADQLRPEPGRYQRRRSEEHTSELQSLMRISYAVFCLKKQK